jgi:hypothetical protein
MVGPMHELHAIKAYFIINVGTDNVHAFYRNTSSDASQSLLQNISRSSQLLSVSGDRRVESLLVHSLTQENILLNFMHYAHFMYNYYYTRF